MFTMASKSMAGTALNNAIRGNGIHDHIGKGIALAGLADPPNDLDDVDTGQNNLQNSPVVTAAVNSNGITTITGTLNSEADKDYRLEFFANAQCGQIRLRREAKPISAPPASRPAVTTQLSAWPFRGQYRPGSYGHGDRSEWQHVRVFAVQASYRAGHGGNHFLQRRCHTASAKAAAWLTINVTRTGGSGGAVSVQYATTSGGTATANDDYAPVSGTLNWGGDGDSANKTFTVPITDDTAYESNETVNLSLSSPGGGASLGNQSSAPLTISDNDQQPALSISDVSVVRGDSGTTVASFSVTLCERRVTSKSRSAMQRAAARRPAASDYQTANGTLTLQSR